MKGVFQTIFQRGISAGLYFPLEEIFTIHLKQNFKGPDSETNEIWLLLVAGLMAGAGNGMIMNPMSSIKYHYWSHTGCSDVGGVVTADKKIRFTTVAFDMFKRGGWRPFFVGMNATISRDVIFGGVFAYLRYVLPKLPFFSTYCAPAPTSHSHVYSSSSSQRAMNDSTPYASPVPSGMLTSPGSEMKSSKHKNSGDQGTNKIESRHTFLTDLLAGFLATTLSSPLNYVRNIHYSLPPDIKPDSSSAVLIDLWRKACQEKTFIGKVSYLQSRLRLGWGTARVGCGMAFASQCYSFIKTQL